MFASDERIWNLRVVVASSLSGLDRLAPESVREVLRLLDLGGYSRTVVTGEDGTVVYDDAGTAGAVTDIADILSSLGGKSVFRSHFTSEVFSSSCAVPVYSRGNMIGAVYLCEQDYERADLISDIQHSLMRISLIIGAVALLFAGVFTTVLLRRMRELVRSIRIVAGGDYAHRLETSGSDEITTMTLSADGYCLTDHSPVGEQQVNKYFSLLDKESFVSLVQWVDQVLSEEYVTPEETE